MGGGLHNPEQTKSFDLLGNPFHILGIEPSASFEQIVKAYDDAVAKQPTSAPGFADARKTLLNTQHRTTAELSFLLDTQDGEAAIILDGLKNAASFQDIALVADNLAPLSRANLLAHVASHGPANADLLFTLVDAHARIAHDALQSCFGHIRDIEGLRGSNSGMHHTSFDLGRSQSDRCVRADGSRV
jgi:hypothetical protein